MSPHCEEVIMHKDDRHLKRSKWMKPICDDPMLGINPVIISALKRSSQSCRVFGNEAFIDTEVIIHSYREIGTALEVSVEARWTVRDLRLTTVRFVNMVI